MSTNETSIFGSEKTTNQEASNVSWTANNRNQATQRGKVAGARRSQRVRGRQSTKWEKRPSNLTKCTMKKHRSRAGLQNRDPNYADPQGNGSDSSEPIQTQHPEAERRSMPNPSKFVENTDMASIPEPIPKEPLQIKRRREIKKRPEFMQQQQHSQHSQHSRIEFHSKNQRKRPTRKELSKTLAVPNPKKGPDKIQAHQGPAEQRWESQEAEKSYSVHRNTLKRPQRAVMPRRPPQERPQRRLRTGRLTRWKPRVQVLQFLLCCLLIGQGIAVLPTITNVSVWTTTAKALPQQCLIMYKEGPP
jgi:hypothetical protein